MSEHAWVPEVIAFWFAELTPRDWWSGSEAMDRRVRSRFATLHGTLAAAPPRPSMLDARGHLALVLVFDQFSRHLFRGHAAAFASDPLALAATLDAIDRQLDTVSTSSHRQFLYMPVMHSEDAAMQAKSLRLFEGLGEPGALRSARDHHATIARFGRFPARNAALGRTSSAEELAFLAERHDD